MKADLTEAKALLEAGLILVPLKPYKKQPEGNNWQKGAATKIDTKVTGYGLPLARNGFCSVDPDQEEMSRVGLAAWGIDQDELLAAGVRTTSTRPGSGGRAMFKAEEDLRWLRMKVNGPDNDALIVLELRANSTNLQDCVPGLVYRTKDSDEVYTQKYANGKTFADVGAMPEKLLRIWRRMSKDDAYRQKQEKLFQQAIIDAGLATAAPPFVPHGEGTLAYPSDWRGEFNRRVSVGELLAEHGYTDHGNDRWSRPGATGAAGIRPIPNKDDLWQTDHGGDSLPPTFDSWVAFVQLEHDGDVTAAESAAKDRVESSAFDDFDVIEEEQEEGPGKATTYKVMGEGIGFEETFGMIKPPAMPFVVEDLIPRTSFGCAGAGGSLKSTTWVRIMMHIVLGKKVFGREIQQPGPCVFFTSEDDLAIIRHRVREMADAMRLTKTERRTLATDLIIEDVNGSIARLVEQDRRGNLRYTKQIAQTIERFQGRGVAMICYDPMIYFGPGENFVNDGPGMLMNGARRLSAALSCAVGFIHHTGQEAFRSGFVDMYAGRGGTAFADNARMVAIMAKGKASKEHPMPEALQGFHDAQVVQVFFPKVSHRAAPDQPLWIMRDPENVWKFHDVWGQERAEAELERRAEEAELERRLELLLLVWAFVKEECDAGRFPSKRTVRELKTVKIDGKKVSRARLEDILEVGVNYGFIREEDLPDEERQGARKYYLEAATKPFIGSGGLELGSDMPADEFPTDAEFLKVRKAMEMAHRNILKLTPPIGTPELDDHVPDLYGLTLVGLVETTRLPHATVDKILRCMEVSDDVEDFGTYYEPCWRVQETGQ